MALIPGEGSTIPNIGSGIGSGIDIVTTAGGVDLLSAFLVAGTNMTIVPSVSNKSITLNAAPGGGGIISVDAAAGSGVTTTTTAAHVSITSAIVGGTGVSVVQSPSSTTLTINNDQTITTANGCGISAVVTGDVTALSANLVAGTGISVTPSGLNTSQTITNAGLTSLAASGVGISVSSSTGAVAVSNTGVTSIVAGTGIGISGATGAVTISASPVPVVPGLYAPTPFLNTGTLSSTVVPLLWNTATNSPVLSNSSLFRYFRVNTPSSVGVAVQIQDSNNNVYPNTDWVLCLSGFANDSVDRTYGVTLLPSFNQIQNWFVIYNQAGGNGIVWILAINRCMFASVQY